ncbi:hypothetical protein HanRHA438_Chr15g0716981 [Helianthus annuus]|nr:hypothetical protein HanRHA438_Chr15g0716981 [Helianthus annuus]
MSSYYYNTNINIFIKLHNRIIIYKTKAMDLWLSIKLLCHEKISCTTNQQRGIKLYIKLY